MTAPGTAALISQADLEAHQYFISTSNIFVTQWQKPMGAAIKGLEIVRSAGVKTVRNPAPAAELPEGTLASRDFVTHNQTECAALTGIKVKTEAGSEKA